MTDLQQLEALSNRLKNWQLAIDTQERMIDRSLTRHDACNQVIDRIEMIYDHQGY